MNTLPTVKEYEVRKFKKDLKKCLNKVLGDFPEFSHTEFSMVIDLLSDTFFEATLSVQYSTRVVKSCVTYIGVNGVRALYDDDRKEGVWAHEFCEALHHVSKKSKEALHRSDRWYEENNGFRVLVEKHADLDAARKGYGAKLVKALSSIKQTSQIEEQVAELESRIKNLGDYLKK